MRNEFNVEVQDRILEWRVMRPQSATAFNTRAGGHDYERAEDDDNELTKEQIEEVAFNSAVSPFLSRTAVRGAFRYRFGIWGVTAVSIRPKRSFLGVVAGRRSIRCSQSASQLRRCGGSMRQMRYSRSCAGWASRCLGAQTPPNPHEPCAPPPTTTTTPLGHTHAHPTPERPSTVG